LNKFLAYIEKHKFAVIGTLIFHVGIFIYLQIKTFPQDIYYTSASHINTFIEPDEEVIELKPESIESANQSNNDGEVHNLTKNENDERKSSSTHYSKSSIDKQVEEELKNFEQSSFQEYSSAHPQKSTPQTSISKEQTKPKNQTNKEQLVSGDGINTQIKGVTMVSYKLSNRYPHNNNDWYIRNPGYTCESSSNGTVVIDISVNQAGEVTEAKVNYAQTSNANACMLEKARTYALMSRFAYKSGAPASQTGTITYRFVAK
jgi:hypothetical protein